MINYRIKRMLKRCVCFACTVGLLLQSLPAGKISAASLPEDDTEAFSTDELDINAYPFMEDTGEESDAVVFDDYIMEGDISEEENIILSGTDISLNGIYVQENNNEHILAGAVLDNPNDTSVEYRWIACEDQGTEWFEISSWKTDMEWLDWTPEASGDYGIVVQVRKTGEENYIETSISISFHKYIIGQCQMPYSGEGGGYLIGFESKENPNQSYNYEMLILDCTLLAEGKDAWIYTTGKCGVAEGNALWTIWQPEYGYYWTLFRLFDADGEMLDEVCYGFQNIPVVKKSWETTYGYSVIEPYLDNILAKCTNDSMTSSQKLRNAYLYVVNNYNYRSLSASHPSDFSSVEYYAYITMTTGYGNCYGFSAVFYFLALKLGYDAKWYSGAVGTRKDPHGWVEINGLIYDAELERYNNVNLYGVTNGHPYKYWY